jgi:hypothetical protein
MMVMMITIRMSVVTGLVVLILGMIITHVIKPNLIFLLPFISAIIAMIFALNK